MKTERAVSFSDLRKMSEKEREQVLGMLVEEARSPANGRIAELDERIREFELRYEVSSETMLKELAEGKQRETADIASWLMLLRLRERVESADPA